jgi:hypothetical protein
VDEQHGNAADPSETRTRLAGLERRVDELERTLARDRRSRSRTRILFLGGIALYVLVLYWELTRIV